jgi:hypothetical protein
MQFTLELQATLHHKLDIAASYIGAYGRAQHKHHDDSLKHGGPVMMEAQH